MKILLLAGTGEAKALARALIGQGHQVVASLAGATRAPRDLGCETRIGGFGGEEGFQTWLDQHAPDLVIDATHPFAARITERTARMCAQRALRYLLLLRPAWVPDATRAQVEIAKPPDAAAHIPPGSRVFLATGRQSLQAFKALDRCYLICRQIDPPEAAFPFPNGQFLLGRPPFSVADEVRLFSELNVDWLVVKNAGGAASYSKIDAAAELGIPVLMIARPDPPQAPCVASVDDALAWVATYADH